MKIFNNSLIVIFVIISIKCSYSQKEDFDQFLYKFANNESFQIERIKFPLTLLKVNDENFEIDTLTISKNEYVFDRLHYNLISCTESYTNIYDNFELQLRDTDERVFRWIGFTDMDVRFYFKRINGKWYLVKKENLGL